MKLFLSGFIAGVVLLLSLMVLQVSNYCQEVADFSTGEVFVSCRISAK